MLESPCSQKGCRHKAVELLIHLQANSWSAFINDDVILDFCTSGTYFLSTVTVGTTDRLSQEIGMRGSQMINGNV